MDPGFIFRIIGSITFSEPWIMTLIFGILFVVFALAGLKRPVAALVLYYGVTIMNPQISYPLLSSLPLAKIAAGICLLSCVLNSKDLHFRFPGLYVSIFIFLFFSVIASINALNYDLSAQRFSEFNKIGLVLVLITWVVNSRKNFDFLFWGMLICFWHNVLKSLVETQTRGAWYAIRGTGGWIGDSNDWALALAMSMPLFFAAIMKKQALKPRIFIGLTLVSALLVLTITSSRGAFLGVAAAAGILILTEPRRFRAVMTGFFLLAIVAAYMPESYLAQVNSIFKSKDVAASYWEEDSNVSGNKYTGAERIHNWRIAWEMMWDHPYTGVGWGNYVANRGNYENYPGDTVAHSTWFQVAAETGLFGLIAYVSMIVIALLSLLRVWRYSRVNNDFWLSLYSRTLMAGIVAFCVGGSFVSRENSELLFLYLGMAACLTFLKDKEDDSEFNPSVNSVTARWSSNR